MMKLQEHMFILELGIAMNSGIIARIGPEIGIRTVSDRMADVVDVVYEYVT
jgi:hypothetical protein